MKDIGFTLLSEGKTIKVRADGYSMYPSVKPGSLIFIQPLQKDEKPKPGEIIAWKRDSGLVVHRLIKIVSSDMGVLLVTRGDSTLAEDLPIELENIAGRVIRIENVHGEEIPPGVYSRRRHGYRLNRFGLKIKLYLGKIRTLTGRLISVP